MQFMTRFIGAFILGIAGFACAAAPAPALAQTPYPTKPVRLIIPFPPGGSTDVLARLLGEKLSSRWGQAVVVDNKPGANTLIGAQAAATAPADGYTLFMPIDFTLTMNQSLYSKLPYDPKKDFAPITLLTVQPILISVNPKLPVKSLRELIDYAKANPGKLSYGTGALIAQVVGEMLKQETHIDMMNVPYKGSVPTLQALVTGEVPVTVGDVLPYLPYLKDRRVIGLAVTGPARSESMPDIPTMLESGYPDFGVRSWFGLVAPAGTPAPIIKKINEDVRAVLAEPAVKERLLGLGLETVAGTPAQFVDQIERDTRVYSKVIKEAGMKLD